MAWKFFFENRILIPTCVGSRKTTISQTRQKRSFEIIVISQLYIENTHKEKA